MKTKLSIALPVLCFILTSARSFPETISSLCSATQDLKIVAVYDGNEGYGYNFVVHRKEDNSEFMMTFKKVNDAVMKAFDLDSEVFINKKFEITYTLKVEVTKDEDGFDQEHEIYTITHLKAL